MIVDTVAAYLDWILGVTMKTGIPMELVGTGTPKSKAKVAVISGCRIYTTFLSELFLSWFGV